MRLTLGVSAVGLTGFSSVLRIMSHTLVLLPDSLCLFDVIVTFLVEYRLTVHFPARKNKINH